MSQNTAMKLKEVRARRDLSVFDLTSIDDLNAQDIELILELAEIFKQSKSEKLDLLTGSTVINAFYEDSTRTRLSFDLAGQHLGADTIGISQVGSSLQKGESMLDTSNTLCALQPKVIVMRTSEAGAPAHIAQHVPCAIVNAGDGPQGEHPTQGLLDAKTILDHHGKLEGKIVTCIGDILHSRVFNSLARIVQRLGGTIRAAAPEKLLPKDIAKLGKVETFTIAEEAIKGSDVLYAIRVKAEYGAKGLISSLEEYARDFCITPERLKLANENAILMDAGPVIRDQSISSELIHHERSKITTQVENGLAVRKALLWLLADRMDGKMKSFIPA